MTNYARLYRLGLTPWEGYGQAAGDSIAALLDREETERSRPLGRALDLGCGRRQFTAELARRGWDAVGIDYVPAAIEAARRAAAGARPAVGALDYVFGDVTDLAADELGGFDFFLDIRCFQGFAAEQRRGAGRGLTALANPGATAPMLAFGPSRFRRLVGGVSRAAVQDAFADWELVDVQAAETTGLGWPMSRTAPQWYRLRQP